jgi:hypothetical protein
MAVAAAAAAAAPAAPGSFQSPLATLGLDGGRAAPVDGGRAAPAPAMRDPAYILVC